jgi:hypothetical protein
VATALGLFWTATGLTGPLCEGCTHELELAVHHGPEGPIVSAVCHACARVIVPFLGPDAEAAVRRWRLERARQHRLRGGGEL